MSTMLTSIPVNCSIRDPSESLSEFLKQHRSCPEVEKSTIIIHLCQTISSPCIQQSVPTTGCSCYVLNRISAIAHRIQNSDFEKEALSSYDAFVTATHIVELENTAQASTCVFIDKSKTGTRSLHYCGEKRQVAVIANPKYAKINEEGAFKKVVSAALVNLSCAVVSVRDAVFAHILKDASFQSNDLEQVNHGLEHMKKLADSTPGVCKLECKLVRCEEIKEGEVTKKSPVEIQAVFEGYQCSLLHIIQDTVLVSDLTKLIIMKDLVRGLIQLHAQNIVNFDIKPGNALFTYREKKACLNDFDFAFNPDLKENLPAIFDWGYYGSIHCTAPEHFGKEKTVYPASYYKQLDAWALGYMFAQLWAHHESLPWAKFIADSFINDFEENKTHTDPARLQKNQDLVKQSIVDTIEEPLAALVKIESSKRTFVEKVQIMLLRLLQYNPENRMQLHECEEELTRLIDEKTKEEAVASTLQFQTDYKNCLTMLCIYEPDQVTSTTHLTALARHLTNCNSEDTIQPFEREEARKIIDTMREIYSENNLTILDQTAHQCMQLFKKLSSAHFETKPLRAQDAWQLAAFCIYYLKIFYPHNDTAPAIEYIPSEKFGLSHALLLDRNNSLVTIISGDATAKKQQKSTFKHYKSAITLSLKSPLDPAINTLFMQNIADDPNDVQAIAKEFRLLQSIKAQLPAGGKMPGLLPLSSKKDDACMLHKRVPQGAVMAVYKEYQGTLYDVMKDKYPLNHRQKVTLCVQLLNQLLSLHQLKIAYGDVKANNALFQIKDDESLEAIWTDFGSAYEANATHPEVVDHLFKWGIYGCVQTTDPHFFGRENAILSCQEHLNLDAWAFGCLLHELFLGPVPWADKMDSCYDSFIEKDIREHPNGSIQNKPYLKSARDKIQKLVQEWCEKPYLQLCTKPTLNSEERLEKVIYGLLQYYPSERISLQTAQEELTALLSDNPQFL